MEFTEKRRPKIDVLHLDYLKPLGIEAHVLRLDRVHPVVSGNKWYKLKEYLNEARDLQKKTILTFGGAYSNHLVATAAACNIFGFQSVGIVRGERPAVFSPSLTDAQQYGMQLVFTNRAAYKEKKAPPEVLDFIPPHEIFSINEGGYGRQGMLGAAEILKELDAFPYSHLLCAVGTGTTLAGLRHQAPPSVHLTGISVLKNNHALEQQVRALLPAPDQPFTIVHDFHFGGYARQKPELIRFMNEWYRTTGIPSDFVYTGKLFFAFEQLCRSLYFPVGSKILLVHSGGLQGNRSLPAGTLIF